MRRLILFAVAYTLLWSTSSAEELHWAARKNNITEIKKLLKRSPSLVHERDIRQGRTPLHFAAEHGSLSAAEILIEYKADVNALGKKEGMTPLHLAAENGKTELVSILLKHGAKREALNKAGKTPTDLAAIANQAAVVLQLVSSKEEASLLVYASVGDLEKVREILAAGEANVNETDKDENTPLLHAARNGHTHVVKALIINHAKVNHTNKDRASALQYAVERGDAELVKLLIAGGADVNMRNGIDQGLLHLAPSHEIAEVLIAVGADTNLKDAEGMTPLHHATMRGDLSFVQLLVEFDADVNLGDSGGLTPLHLAAQYDHHELAAYLLEQKADPNRVTHLGETPLHACAKSRNHPRAVAPMLLKAGADVNARNHEGLTALDLEEAVIKQYIGIGLDEEFLTRVHQTANLYIKHGGKNGKAIRN